MPPKSKDDLNVDDKKLLDQFVKEYSEYFGQPPTNKDLFVVSFLLRVIKNSSMTKH